MRRILPAMTAIALLGFAAVKAGVEGQDGSSYQSQKLIAVPSPKSDLVAVVRSPIPSTDVPDFTDADGSLIFIRGRERGDRIIAHRFFAGRFITKLAWSPDGQFLAICSESTGGHSPWHFNSYFWSRADGKFRSIDFRAGLVVSDEFTFDAPHHLTVRVANPDPEGGLDLEHPVTNRVDLAKLRVKTPLLRPSPWP